MFFIDSLLSSHGISQTKALAMRYLYVKFNSVSSSTFFDVTVPVVLLISFAIGSLVESFTGLGALETFFLWTAPRVLQAIITVHLFKYATYIAGDESQGVKGLLVSMNVKLTTYYWGNFIGFALILSPTLGAFLFVSKRTLEGESEWDLAMSIGFLLLLLPAQLASTINLANAVTKSHKLVWILIVAEWWYMHSKFESLYNSLEKSFKPLLMFATCGSPMEAMRFYVYSFSSCAGMCNKVLTVGRLAPAIYPRRFQSREMILFSSASWILITYVLTYVIDCYAPRQIGMASRSPLKSLTIIKNFFCGDSKSSPKEDKLDSDKDTPNEPITGTKRNKIAIQTEYLTKIYPSNYKRALDDVSVKLVGKETSFVVGDSGSGKSTLFDIILNRELSSSGKVDVNVRKVSSQLASPTIGVVVKESILDNRLTVRQHLSVFAGLKSTNLSSIKQLLLVEKYLAELNLEKEADRSVAMLGENSRRLLGVGCALIGQSKLFILDDPTCGLDAKSVPIVWDMLKRVRGSGTLLVASRSMRDAELMADRLVVLSSGRVVASGSSLYLKRRFNCGYVLTVKFSVGTDRENEPNVSSLIAMVRQYFSGAEMTKLNEDSVDIALSSDAELASCDITSSNQEAQQMLALLRELENSKSLATFGFSSFTLGNANLEDLMFGASDMGGSENNKNNDETGEETGVSSTKDDIGMVELSKKSQQPTIIDLGIDELKLLYIIVNCRNPKMNELLKKTKNLETSNDDDSSKTIGNSNRYLLMKLSSTSTCCSLMHLFALSDKLVSVVKRNMMRSLLTSIVLPLLGSYYITMDLRSRTISPSSKILWWLVKRFGSFITLTLVFQFLEIPFNEVRSSFKSIQLHSNLGLFNYWLSFYLVDSIRHIFITCFILNTLVYYNFLQASVQFATGYLYGHAHLSIAMVLFGSSSILLCYNICSLFGNSSINGTTVLIAIHCINPILEAILGFLDTFGFILGTYNPFPIFELANSVLAELLPANALLFTLEALHGDVVPIIVPKRVQRDLFPSMLKPSSLLNTTMSAVDSAKNAVDSAKNVAISTATSAVTLVTTNPLTSLLDNYNPFKSRNSFNPIKYYAGASLMMFQILAFAMILISLEFFKDKLLPKLKSSCCCGTCCCDEPGSALADDDDATPDGAQVGCVSISEKSNESVSKLTQRCSDLLDSSAKNKNNKQQESNYSKSGAQHGSASADDQSASAHALIASNVRLNVSSTVELSLLVPRKSALCLLGPACSGKSTCLRLLSLDASLGGGKLRAPCRAITGYSPQTCPLVSMTTYELLTLMAMLRYVPTINIHRCVSAYLELLKLSPKRRVDKLGGSASRRLTLAAALIGNPQLVFVDEPTIDCGVESQIVWRLINSLAQRTGMSVVIATKNVTEACLASQTIAVMAAHRICAYGSPEDLETQASIGVSIKAAILVSASKDNSNSQPVDSTKLLLELTRHLSNTINARLEFKDTAEAWVAFKVDTGSANLLSSAFEAMEEFKLRYKNSAAVWYTIESASLDDTLVMLARQQRQRQKLASSDGIV